MNKQSAGLKIQRSFGWHDVGIFYRYSQNISQSTTYNYLNGPAQTGKLYYNYNARKYFLSLFISASKDSTGDLVYLLSGSVLPIANDTRSIGLTASFYPNDRWELSNTLSYADKIYKTPAIPDGSTRKDKQVSNYTKVSYRLTFSLKTYLSEEMTLNSSTLNSGMVADKNFNKFITLFGVSWDALP